MILPLTLLIALLLGPPAALHAAAPAKPNIIFILADDLGIGNLSCYGSDNYKSPHLDKLAATGTRFTQSFTGALCGPSRALIMTGRYAFRNGSSNQDACMVMPNSELQLGRVFKSAGYATSFIGKWGQLPGDPDAAGFDDYLRFNGSGVYWNKKAGKAEAYRVNGKELKLGDKEYMPDLMHDRVATFLRANQTKPFFLYYSMVHVHGDIQPTPDSAPDSKDLFGDNIRYMDKLVGKLVAELEALKLRDNTLIIFMGDNGTGKGQNPRSTIGGRNLSGMKGSMLECGGLVPTIANWPGKVPSGKVSADLIDSTDWLPTFAELSGGKLPEKTIFDGHSIAPQLRGEHGTRREWIYNQLAAMWYVREAGWKLNEKGELYDMSDAPFTEKLVAASADTAASKAARARLTAVLAKLNPAGGIPDSGDGTGRHANKEKKKTAKPAKAATSPPAIPGAARAAVAAERAAPLPPGTLHAASRPNVLFIAVDDLRPDLGCYGNSVAKSPNIDRIAARGTVFNRAYVQQAVCSPSRTAIMTGLRPDTTRVWDLETHFRVAQPDCITLPQHFKANGYHCAALSKIYHAGLEDGRSWNEPHWYPKGRAVDTDPVDWTKQIVTRHDVNVEEFSAPQEGPERKSGKSPKKGPSFEVSPKQDDELPDGATAAEAVKRLHDLKSKGKPFFLAVGFLKPHLPFVAPKKYWDLYDPNTIPLPTIDHLPKGAPAFAGHNNSELHNYPGVPAGEPIPADFAKKLRHGYYACISHTDAQIGRVLDALEKEGLADNTIIVLWGDHGWQLGDHGLWHKHTNFELATRAPLLISVPKQKSAGQKCNAPVEFVDVYPTLADLCGLPKPTGLPGSSLKPFIENPAAPMAKVAISQYPRKAPKGNVMGYSIRDERWRATFWRERNGTRIVATELYDEQNDPSETASLHDKPEHKALLETLAKSLPPVLVEPASAKVSSKKKGKTASAKSAGDPAKTSDATAAEARGPKFDKLDEGKTGRITRAYYTSHQSDPKAARERFDKWDTNQDGFLSREEFIAKGGKSLKVK